MTNGGLQNIAGFGRAGVQVIGMNAVTRFIERLVGRVRNIHPVLMIIGHMMRAEILSHFPQKEGDKGKSSDGSDWPDLSEMTIAMRTEGDPSKGRDPMALRDTGSLYASITYKIEGEMVYAGSNKKYAELQNFGGTTEEGFEVPAREFVWISDAKVQQMVDRLVNDLIAATFAYG